MTLVVVLMDMVHVRRENPGPAFTQIYLHDAQPWCMPGRMSHIQPWCYFQEISVECLPIQVKGQVMRKIDA